MSKNKKPGYRYETCRECGLEWNVSKQKVLPLNGYLCPRCWSQYNNKKEQER